MLVLAFFMTAYAEPAPYLGENLLIFDDPVEQRVKQEFTRRGKKFTVFSSKDLPSVYPGPHKAGENKAFPWVYERNPLTGDITYIGDGTIKNGIPTALATPPIARQRAYSQPPARIDMTPQIQTRKRAYSQMTRPTVSQPSDTALPAGLKYNKMHAFVQNGCGACADVKRNPFIVKLDIHTITGQDAEKWYSGITGHSVNFTPTTFFIDAQGVPHPR